MAEQNKFKQLSMFKINEIIIINQNLAKIQTDLEKGISPDDNKTIFDIKVLIKDIDLKVDKILKGLNDKFEAIRKSINENIVTDTEDSESCSSYIRSL